MRTMKEGILLLALTASALFCLTSAGNKVCINGNSQIVKLVCDGVDYTGQLSNRINPNKCDCIRMPVCKKVAVKAKGVRGQQIAPGISFCQTAYPAAYKDWVCAKATSVEGNAWTGLSYDTLRWKSAAKPKGRCRHCRGLKFLPCKSKCFWNRGIPALAVDCSLEQCEDECDSCQNTGPGKCDPGRCRFGENINVLTNERHCNRRCRVDWHAWGYTKENDTTTTGTGYIKLTDVRTHSVDVFQANQQGFYVATVDMTSCTFSYKNHSSWRFYDDYKPLSDLVQNWFANTTGPNANTVAVTLAVGGSLSNGADKNGLRPSRAPEHVAYLLGTGQLNVLVNGFACSASVVLTGINNAPVTTSSYQKIDPLIDMNTPLKC